MERSFGRVIRFGVLGYGKIARTRFVPSLARVPIAQLTAIGTRTPDDLVAERWPAPVPPCILRYEDLLREGRNLVDAIYIALPNDLHEEWILRAAEAGLHVLCEKPLAVTHAAAQRSRRKCEECGVLLAEAFMYRHDPRHQHVRALICSGSLGTVHLVEASFSYFLEDLSNIRLQSDRWGGALMDVGCYGIDVARLLVGEEPVEVTARGIQGTRSGVDEVTAIILRFPTGPMAVVTASTHVLRHHEYRVRGARGTALVPNAFVPGDTEHTRVIVESPNGDGEVVDFPPFAPFIAQITHFAGAIGANDRARLLPMEDGVANARVLEAAHRSLEAARLPI
jgi:predicted dehydrogenase